MNLSYHYYENFSQSPFIPSYDIKSRAGRHTFYQEERLQYEWIRNLRHYLWFSRTLVGKYASINQNKYNETSQASASDN